MAINEVNDKLLDFIGEATDPNSPSYKLVHICTNVPVKDEKSKESEEYRLKELHCPNCKNNNSKFFLENAPLHWTILDVKLLQNCLIYKKNSNFVTFCTFFGKYYITPKKYYIYQNYTKKCHNCHIS
jgi:hypothetical protein